MEECRNTEDELILVDLFDRETGHAGKLETHQKAKLHRAFSVFLYHEGRMLIQQRAFDKYHSGGLWANACCSHPRYGEDLSVAVKRRLGQELGISADVKELFSFVYYSKYSEQMHEYEYDHVFAGDYSGEVFPEPGEIHQVKWVDFDWLINDLAENPDSYSTWFLTAAPGVLRILKNKSEVI